MKKSLVPLFFVIAFLTVFTLAGPKPKLNFGKELNSSQCDKVGKPVINIVETIVNTVDSGVCGNYWAFDDIIHQIKVWEQKDGTYCAIVKNEGHFDAQAGQASPGGIRFLCKPS